MSGSIFWVVPVWTSILSPFHISRNTVARQVYYKKQKRQKNLAIAVKMIMCFFKPVEKYVELVHKIIPVAPQVQPMFDIVCTSYDCPVTVARFVKYVGHNTVT